MIENPDKYISEYAKAGSDTIIIHYEASQNIKKDLQEIRSYNKKAGLAINPSTDSELLKPYLDNLDYILIMSVFPGFGGQKFIEATLETMKYLKGITKKHDIIIGVDGGVNLSTIDRVYQAGADITIVGSALYGAKNIEKRYLELINEK